ncbi:unnamed protein product [Sphacelaria rigidula]
MVTLLEVVSSIGEDDDDDDDDDKDTPRTDRQRRGSLYIVLEYLEHDLAGLLDLNITRVFSTLTLLEDISRWFSDVQIKGIMRQLLNVLDFVHSNMYVHRDIKCSNLLIDNNCRLKLADFGLARRLSDVPADLTNRVITLWYRPPELLLGATRYGPTVDSWGVGCILAEIIIGKPLFPAKVELEQLDLILQVCGTPTPKIWPGYDELPSYNSMMPSKKYPGKLKNHLTEFARKIGNAHLMTPDVVDLIERLLTLDPARRWSANKALKQANYFRTDPIVSDSTDLGGLQLPERNGSYHEYQTKKKRKQDGLNQQEAKRAIKRKKAKLSGMSNGERAVKTDAGRGGERTSSPNSGAGLTGAAHRGGAHRGGTHGNATGGPSQPPLPPAPPHLSHHGRHDSVVSSNWAPPLPPPGPLAPPPPPQHDTPKLPPGAPPLPTSAPPSQAPPYYQTRPHTSSWDARR